MLRLDLTRRDEVLSVLLDLSGRGNLEVHDPGHAPQALRPPAGDLPATLPPLEMSDDDARARLVLETSRLQRLRARLLHERNLGELRQRLRRACKGALTLVERREADGARLGDPSDLRTDADALAAHLHLMFGFLTRGIQDRADFAGKVCRRLQEQRRLADARFSAEQHQ